MNGPILVRVPLSFFVELYPFNMEVLNGNAMALRACGASKDDGSLFRSRETIVFGHGLLTLVLQAQWLQRTGITEYTLRFVPRTSRRNVAWWEVQGTKNQEVALWTLTVSRDEPDPDDGQHILRLASVDGHPGQYIYLTQTA